MAQAEKTQASEVKASVINRLRSGSDPDGGSWDSVHIGVLYAGREFDSIIVVNGDDDDDTEEAIDMVNRATAGHVAFVRDTQYADALFCTLEDGPEGQEWFREVIHRSLEDAQERREDLPNPEEGPEGRDAYGRAVFAAGTAASQHAQPNPLAALLEQMGG